VKVWCLRSPSQDISNTSLQFVSSRRRARESPMLCFAGKLSAHPVALLHAGVPRTTIVVLAAPEPSSFFLKANCSRCMIRQSSAMYIEHDRGERVCVYQHSSAPDTLAPQPYMSRARCPLPVPRLRPPMALAVSSRTLSEKNQINPLVTLKDEAPRQRRNTIM